MKKILFIDIFKSIIGSGSKLPTDSDPSRQFGSDMTQKNYKKLKNTGTGKYPISGSRTTGSEVHEGKNRGTNYGIITCATSLGWSPSRHSDLAARDSAPDRR